MQALLQAPGDLPDPGIKRGSPELQADALPSEAPGKHSANTEKQHIIFFLIDYIFSPKTWLISKSP